MDSFSETRVKGVLLCSLPPPPPRKLTAASCDETCELVSRHRVQIGGPKAVALEPKMAPPASPKKAVPAVAAAAEAPKASAFTMDEDF